MFQTFKNHEVISEKNPIKIPIILASNLLPFSIEKNTRKSFGILIQNGRQIADHP